jgi:hypothetical protein
MGLSVVVSRGLLEAGTPAHRVLYFRHEPSYLVLSEDTPEDPAELSASDFRSVCLGCLLDRHPELGRGLDVAREARSSPEVGGARWVPAVGDWLEEACE